MEYIWNPNVIVNGCTGNWVPASTETSQYRTTGLSSTAVSIKLSQGNLLGVKAINQNTSKAYVKFCNYTGLVTAGTSTIASVFEVPANDGTNDGQLLITPTFFPLYSFSSGISAYAVTALPDNASTTPTVAIYFETAYL